VNFGKVVRTHAVKGNGCEKIRKGEQRPRRCERARPLRSFERADHMVHRISREVMQREDTGDSGHERGWNLGIAGVSPVVIPVYIVLVNLGMKCVLLLRRRSRKFDYRA